MPEISAVIITFNEEKYIEQCLRSLDKVVGEIVVVDSFSTDSTEDICRRYNVRFIRHAFEGYVQQKNYALTQASNSLILSIDADEALSDELKQSILEIKEHPKADGYYVNRINNYCGKWLKHTRLFPERHLRLFNKEKGKWTGPNPHDRFILNQGSVKACLKGNLLHWNYDSLEEHVNKMNTFSSIAADEYFRNGIKPFPCAATLHMLWSFFRSYVFRLGFIDGYSGYTECSIIAYASFLKYTKLRNLYNEAKKSRFPS